MKVKPIINLDTLDKFEEHEKGSFHGKYAILSDNIGASRLGYNLTIVKPGKKSCPFHNHYINEEMFLILDGQGTLRFGEEEFAVAKHDIIACPPGGKEVAHQLINTGATDLKYLALSTRDPYDICEYPDSNKVLSMAGTYAERKLRHMSSLDNSLDYFDGEE